MYRSFLKFEFEVGNCFSNEQWPGIARGVDHNDQSILHDPHRPEPLL